jgi:hypothetical protein
MHHYYTSNVLKIEGPNNITKVGCKEGKWYNTEQIINTETLDSSSDVNLKVSLWRKDQN